MMWSVFKVYAFSILKLPSCAIVDPENVVLYLSTREWTSPCKNKVLVLSKYSFFNISIILSNTTVTLLHK